MRIGRRHRLDSKQLKQALLRAAIDTLKADPYVTVLRRPEGGSSAYTFSEQGPDGGRERGLDSIDYITIKTSQNQWIGFTRDKTDTYWKGIKESWGDVIVSAVDDIWNPTRARVHKFHRRDVEARLDKAYEAIKKAGKKVKPGAPISISLYDRQEDSSAPSHLVGAGIGIKHPPIAVVPLKKYMSLTAKKPKATNLTIPEARRRLAASYGVPIHAVTIEIDRSSLKPKSAPQRFGQAEALAEIKRTRHDDARSMKIAAEKVSFSQNENNVAGSKRKNAPKLDVYQGTQDPMERMAVRVGKGLPAHLDPDDWQLMPPGSSPIFKGVGGDIRARGFCYYRLVVVD